jgi:2-pyrone-4,6-dicarboxylate lactonase
VPVVIDHLGYVDTTRGPYQPACRWICDKLKDGDWWVMISNGNRLSPMQSGWDDAVPIARAFIEAAPDRIIWGSDWPHSYVFEANGIPNDGDLIDMLLDFAPDETVRKKILVDNPTRLFDFD